MELDDKVCYCFHVRKRKILNFIRMHRPRRASQISECGGAGTGCGWCIPFLQRYFDEARKSGSLPAEPEPTPEEYARLRARYIQEGKGTPAAGAEPIPSEPARED
ncbi:MAG: (2Fe-2S)-binding protein [Planctomycetaceae bacterium]|nr:(2Fe-2S)-binding protein [Planctomycetaceae bacterium]